MTQFKIINFYRNMWWKFLNLKNTPRHPPQFAEDQVKDRVKIRQEIQKQV